MTEKRLPIILIAITMLFAVLFVALGALPAQAGVDTAAAEIEVVASGLANPRGLAFGPDGALYIAEAGVGGEGACIEGPEGEVCYGETGVISKVILDQTGRAAALEPVVSGLSSLGGKDTGDSAIGPSDVAFNDAGDLFVLMGLGADPALRDPQGPLGAAGINFGQLVAVDDQGKWRNMVDIAAYEAANNPDGAQVDSNPFALISVGGGFKVVDAGGNDLLDVQPGYFTWLPVVTSQNGSLLTTAGFNAAQAAAAAQISTTAVFPARMVEFPPGSGEMIPMDAVPTAVEMGPDGAYYVSQLTGFPFPVGGANIYRVVPGEAPQVYRDGFTNVLDLAFGADGSLYVLEMAKDSLLAEPPPVGQIIQVKPDGTRTVIASEGLIAPVDLEIGPDQALYVANFGPVANQGQVVRITLPQSTVTIPAARDNTLYESESGALSNGAGQHLFAGLTAAKTGNLARRGVIAFDLDGALPEGATILSVELELNMSRSISGDQAVALHELQRDWGEGASDAAGEEGAGANATTGDATWLHTFFNSDTWSAAGGDFNPTASASTTVGGVGQYSWSSAQLTADVQGWVDDPSTNFGWLILGDEGGDPSAKRFDSREHPEEANRPQLTIQYLAP